MRFAIAAGGTGGHLFPGLAVAEVLHAKGHEVMLLTSEKQIDAVATEGRKEFRIERLPGMGLPRGISLKTVQFATRFFRGVLGCQSLFQKFRPAGVLGMGGFTSTAPILAARLRGVPTFVHESNAIPGKANRLNARIANGVLLGWEVCAERLPRTRWVCTGTPVRRALNERVDPSEARKRFGLDPQVKTVLGMGGSQGAQGINRALVESVSGLRGGEVQVIHLSGPADEGMVRAAYAKLGLRAWVGAFHHAMQDAYSAADVAVARSGAASLTELAHFGVPSVLIPYPFAAEDHQTWNARVFEKAGAAVLLPEKEATGERLRRVMEEMLKSERHAAMRNACTGLAVPDAAERVAQVLLEVAQKGGLQA